MTGWKDQKALDYFSQDSFFQFDDWLVTAPWIK